MGCRVWWDVPCRRVQCGQGLELQHGPPQRADSHGVHDLKSNAQIRHYSIMPSKTWCMRRDAHPAAPWLKLIHMYRVRDMQLAGQGAGFMTSRPSPSKASTVGASRTSRDEDGKTMLPRLLGKSGGPGHERRERSQPIGFLLTTLGANALCYPHTRLHPLCTSHWVYMLTSVLTSPVRRAQRDGGMLQMMGNRRADHDSMCKTRRPRHPGT